jgi:glycosyltransferase 2 family protein
MPSENFDAAAGAGAADGGPVQRLRTVLKPLGYVVTALSLVYIVNIFLHFDWRALHFQNPLLSVAFILGFGVWASLFVLVGAYNWKLILEFLSGAALPARDVFTVYLKSNVAKYLPGNVMHYAGRNFLGSKLGWNNSEIAFSSLLEFVFGAGLTGIVIALFMAAGLVTLPPQVPLTLNYQRVSWYLGLAALASIFLILGIYAYRYLVHRESLRTTSAKLRGRGSDFFSLRFLWLLGKLFAVSAGSFVFNCAFYFYLCDYVLGFRLHPGDFFTANAAVTIGSYAGILTPGMPGGVGVRESVAILLLSAYGYPKESLVLSLIVFRIACILGDLFPYFTILLWQRRGRSEAG